MTATKTWELAIPLTWDSYRDRLRAAAAASGYHERERAGAREMFSRLSGGDTFILELELLSAGPPLGVRATLTALPD